MFQEVILSIQLGDVYVPGGHSVYTVGGVYVPGGHSISTVRSCLCSRKVILFLQLGGVYVPGGLHSIYCWKVDGLRGHFVTGWRFSM